MRAIYRGHGPAPTGETPQAAYATLLPSQPIYHLTIVNRFSGNHHTEI